MLVLKESTRTVKKNSTLIKLKYILNHLSKNFLT